MLFSNPKASKLCQIPLSIGDSCGESTRCRIRTTNLRPDRPNLWPGQRPGDAGDAGAGCFEKAADLNFAINSYYQLFSHEADNDKLSVSCNLLERIPVATCNKTVRSGPSQNQVKTPEVIAAKKKEREAESGPGRSKHGQNQVRKGGEGVESHFWNYYKLWVGFTGFKHEQGAFMCFPPSGQSHFHSFHGLQSLQ